MKENLAVFIPNTAIDSDLIGKYNTITQTLLNDFATTVAEVKPAQANMYAGDLYGLFKNVIGVPLDAIYPCILANGYKSSQSYDGNTFKFTIVSAQAVTDFVRLFKK